MDDATLTALVQRAQRATIARDGRQDTIVQRIADILGISANQPESVSQEALAQYRGQANGAGTIYRTINDAGNKTGRQIAHELTSSNDYGLNFGGGRVFGCGLYFAGSGVQARGNNLGAFESSLYGSSSEGAYTIEARFKPGARIAGNWDITGPQGQAWAKSHAGALRSMGLKVDSQGNVTGNHGTSSADVKTIMALCMGYDAYRNTDSTTPYFTVFNRGVLQVARGNKYDRAANRSL